MFKMDAEYELKIPSYTLKLFILIYGKINFSRLKVEAIIIYRPSKTWLPNRVKNVSSLKTTEGVGREKHAVVLFCCRKTVVYLQLKIRGLYSY